MLTITTVDELRAELDAVRLSGRSIGLVPTMGALHEGHLSLVDRSVAENGVTVVTSSSTRRSSAPARTSTPTPASSPTTWRWPPSAAPTSSSRLQPEEVYPDGHATTVSVVGITETLCGAPEHRGHEHFDGVTTVVAKLFNMVQADRAYFGQKDAQQVAVIRRMATDLNFRTRVIACPTVREADGLALSSRNVYLSAEERVRALSLSRALRAVAGAIGDGEREVAALLELAHAELTETDSIDYFEIVDPVSLAELTDDRRRRARRRRGARRHHPPDRQHPDRGRENFPTNARPNPNQSGPNQPKPVPGRQAQGEAI